MVRVWTVQWGSTRTGPELCPATLVPQAFAQRSTEVWMRPTAMLVRGSFLTPLSCQHESLSLETMAVPFKSCLIGQHYIHFLVCVFKNLVFNIEQVLSYMICSSLVINFVGFTFLSCSIPPKKICIKSER